MTKVGHYVIVYDISDNRERHKVSKTLEGYGFRVQKSAFECLLSRSGRNRLQDKLFSLNIKTGFVTIYQISANAQKIDIGKVPENNIDEGHAFIV